MVSWSRRSDLSPQEIAAIASYLGYGEDINAYLRSSAEYIPSISKIITYLDSAILKSHLPFNSIVFRGVSGDYSNLLLERILDGDREITDRAYTSYTTIPKIAWDYATATDNSGIIFVYECHYGDCALEIGGDEMEIIFPRNTRWNMITLRREIVDDCSVTYINVEKT